MDLGSLEIRHGSFFLSLGLPLAVVTSAFGGDAMGKPAAATSAPASQGGADPMMLAAVGVAAIVLLVVLAKLLGGSSKKKFLDKTRQQVTLGERVNLSHDTVRFRFTLPKSAPVLGLPVGKHFKLFAPNMVGKVAGEFNGREDPEADESEIERKYTPTTSDDEIGYVDLVIKVYKGGVVDRFPDGGKMSQYMDTLKVGDQLTIQGPIGMNEYMGKGQFKIGQKLKTCKKLAMMAGGTGITPMLQVRSLAPLARAPRIPARAHAPQAPARPYPLRPGVRTHTHAREVG